ncbi:Two-component sensor histidine kinase, contains HisKA and HATPase domains [Gemmobacter aquatilis]|uniref:histidine kinase n=1 Tax=Gemmobacter aquatilis TaxID=933059 RepID=A0A1H7YC56_9RHOB|nr:histidine kinase dimerization/phosphoacceptor domain -containing protein [Gemmobacter aquatilis]SEM43444.1 Two-component sensor histidine kinase, contains HisKA and HATPase domains [Gemmobacter aquatilis]
MTLAELRARLHPFVSGLGFRLMIMFGIVMMPLAVLSYVQTRQYQTEAAARAEAAVLGATMRAAAPLVEEILRGQGAVNALAAALPGVVGDPVACTALLARFLAEPGNAQYTFVGYVPRNLQMDCSPQGARDLTAMGYLRDLMDAGAPKVRVNRNGPVSHQSVLIFSHPVRDVRGVVIGLVSLSLPHAALTLPAVADATAKPGTDPVALITFDQEGTLLTTSVGLDAAPQRLPRDRSLKALTGDGATSFTGYSVGGVERVFAVVPLASGSVFLLGNWPMTATDVTIFRTPIPIIAYPVLMWLASLLVAHLAAEHQVLRHMRTLRASITSFAAGNRRLPDLDLDHAPLELQSVGLAFERMMESVLHDEAELEDMVHQKEVLLREVHHRVKNNLQLIASIINMQIRKARSPESKTTLKGLQDRVMSLATIHRELYQTTGLTDIRADELLQRILEQILRMGGKPGAPFLVETTLDDIHLTPDQAVPLSLLVTEALTNALKYASAPAGQRPRLRVCLRRLPDCRAGVEIANSITGSRGPHPALMEGDASGSGLGEALVRAFAAQLGTAVTREEHDGEFILRFDFRPSALANAEARLAADEPENTDIT